MGVEKYEQWTKRQFILFVKPSNEKFIITILFHFLLFLHSVALNYMVNDIRYHMKVRKPDVLMVNHLPNKRDARPTLESHFGGKIQLPLSTFN